MMHLREDGVGIHLSIRRHGLILVQTNLLFFLLLPQTHSLRWEMKSDKQSKVVKYSVVSSTRRQKAVVLVLLFVVVANRAVVVDWKSFS